MTKAVNTPAANIREYSAETAADNLRKENEELQKKLDASIEASTYFGEYLKRLAIKDYDSPLHILDAALAYASTNEMFVAACYKHLYKNNIPTGHLADFCGCLTMDNTKCRFESDEFRYLNYIAHTERFEIYRDIFVPVFAIFALHYDIEILCDFISKNNFISIKSLLTNYCGG